MKDFADGAWAIDQDPLMPIGFVFVGVTAYFLMSRELGTSAMLYSSGGVDLESATVAI